MCTYGAVNDAINRVIFDGRHKLGPVYLEIEGQVTNEIAAHLSIPATDCVDVISKAVAASLTWNRQDPFSWHLSELDAWSALERFGTPPFTALLAALSIAAERMRADHVYSAQNYYERLFEVLGIDNESRKNSLRQNAKSTRGFWEALNLWLAQNDFDFGRPTAKRINDWPYVSFALSQALLRRGDRERIHNLFVEYGLAPHEKLTDAEMTLYLHEWMRGPAPSSWLKRIWASPDLRPRVAAAACAELEAWEGVGEAAEAGGQRRRLSWAASLQTFPRRELRMFMSAAGADDDSQITLTLPTGLEPAAASAFEHCTNGLWLTPSASGEIAVIEPVQDIALSPLMLASFELEANEGGMSFHRAARAIVPMVKLDTGAFYREVSRISFLRPHLVLCHEKWGDRVSSLLKLSARQGFTKWTAQALRGLPQEWLLFSSVEMLRGPSVTGGDLQALAPLSQGVSIEMAGGLRLSQNLWHAAAPPEITAAGPAGPLALELRNAAEEAVAANGSKGSSCRLTLSREQSWDASDFTLTASIAGKVRSEVSLSFRSADQPRRLTADGQLNAYRVAQSDPVGFLTAKPTDGAFRGLFIRGMGLHGVSQAVAGPHAIELDAISGAQNAEDEMPTEMEGRYKLHSVDGLQETCVLRGHHYWIVDAFNAGDDPRDDKWMTCRSCKSRVLTRNRGAPPKKTMRRLTPTGATRAEGPPPMGARTIQAPGPDLILDAIFYLGSGSWRRLQDLAATQDGPVVAAQRLSQALISLGHIDVSYDDRLRSQLNWVAAPPALVFTPSGSAFLAGFRNEVLLDTISACLVAAGGALEVTVQEDAPAAYIWSGLDPSKAEHFLAKIQDVHGRKLAVTRGFTAAVASNGPTVSELAAHMRPIHLDGPKDLQRFDPGSGTWRAVNAIDSMGAYRGDYAGRRYIFCDSMGSQREGSFGLVKLLAARAAGLKLHSYDPRTRVFQAVLGCDPPGLYSRALTASSGLIPQRAGPKLHYCGIDPNDATLILSKLYS